MNCIIFGGTGFIGRHFALYLIHHANFEKVILADIKALQAHEINAELQHAINSKQIEYVYCDVRNPIDIKQQLNIDLIANFAAIHREPGHGDWEYFDTNVKGATNVCEFADKCQCAKIIFTSSISPYGPTEESKDEQSALTPETAYGKSKLEAEQIHQVWQASDSPNKNLVTVRPGVVFGSGEGGNVTRLIKAIKGRYFFYTGNKETIKAGVYIKELCYAMNWVMQQQLQSNETFSLFNMTMQPSPSMNEYVKTICEVAGFKRFIPSCPYGLLYATAYMVECLASLLKIKQPISPIRVRKLVRSNNIVPKYLASKGYQYQYTLKSAFEDWKKDNPSDW